MALHEERAPVRVEPRREQLRDGQPGVGGQLLRVLRNRDRVQVDDHVERVVGLLEGHPLTDGAEVVAEVERACGGLDSGEHAGTV
jgi:endonuclease III